MIRVINEVKLGTINKSSGIYLMAEENPKKLQLGYQMMVMWPVITSKGVPYLHMTSLGSHSTQGSVLLYNYSHWFLTNMKHA